MSSQAKDLFFILMLVILLRNEPKLLICASNVLKKAIITETFNVDF